MDVLGLRKRVKRVSMSSAGARILLSAFLEGTMPEESTLAPTPRDSPEALYLDLMKKCLTRSAFPEQWRRLNPTRAASRVLSAAVQLPLRALGLQLVRSVTVDRATREQGRDVPQEGETMIGLRRLDNLQECVTDVVRRHVPGDLIETGVWRGGATIFMRAVLKALGDRERIVWVADSFRGLPAPDRTRRPDEARRRNLRAERVLVASLSQVKENFARYGLLDDQVRFLEGWFDDTLPRAPIKGLAVLRLDGDLYESTMIALRHLYPRLSVGGYAIIDDYGDMDGCRAAVDEFRSGQGIAEELRAIDQTGVFWQRLG